MALHGLSHLRDPILSMQNRHIERDIRMMPTVQPEQRISAGSEFTMMWPNWEAGFGDLTMWTILPLGFALHEQMVPNGTVAISGALYSRAWLAFSRARQLCTFERFDVYQVPDGPHTIREMVRNPLPRCPEVACYETIRLCEPLPLRREQSWRAQVTLDSLLGFPQLSLASRAAYGVHGRLRIVIARRLSWHGRSLLNGANITRDCRHMQLNVHSPGEGRPSRWELHCQHLSLGSLPLRRVVAILRETDVLVSMHGADVINGLHMPPGRAILEVVNYNFDRTPEGGPFWFVSCFERHLKAVYAHKRLTLAPVLRGEQAPSRAWNLNGSLPRSLLLQALTSVIRRDGKNRFHELPRRLADLPASVVLAHFPPPIQSTDLATVRTGYCDFTDEEEGDCDRGGKGSFSLGSRLPANDSYCTAACLSCPRCRFVSISVEHGDCSWFHSCRVDDLRTNPAGFRSWRVRL